ncbi:MAG: hypothetical protein HUU50_04625 [Candidatus Brocadiae bacterium]|nr:hypothetical protein [Candidatus Brocadiia bacterium]
MKFLLFLGILLCFCCIGNAEWVTVFDHPHADNTTITYSIPSNILNTAFTQLRYYSLDGRTAVLNAYLSNSTLQDHINQSWLYTGFESDYYKRLSVDAGTHTSSVFIANDHDIREGGTQTARPGTPFGLITLGYSNSSSFIDGGSATYYSGFGGMIYRLDINTVSVPEVSSLILLCLVFASIGFKKYCI